MINYETILSLFDDKLTLLQYLTKIEEALRNEQLTDITVTQPDASHVYFTFVFEDGSTIDTPTFTLPAGPQGIQGPAGEDGQDGADGVSVVDAEIDASGHLILTLSNGNTIDAGATGLQTVTASDVDSETATQYEVLKADGNGGASWGKVLASNIDPQTATSEKFLQAGLYGGAVWSKISRGSIDTTGETSGKVLTTDGSGGASWQTASGGTTLNKYVANISANTTGWSLLYRIILNAKGKLSITQPNQSGNRPVTFAITKDDPQKVFLTYYGTNSNSDGFFFLYVQLTSFGALSGYIYGTANSTFGTSIGTPNFYVEYYNDTEIT